MYRGRSNNNDGQMIAYHHVLKRQDCRSREIVISRVIFRNVFTLRMMEERRSHL